MAATHTFQNLALPSGSLILVTGANGYIASHVVDQLLQLGYRVRGTTRGDRPWLNDFFIKKYGKACFETMIVEDMTSPTAFDLALQGVKGVVLVVRIYLSVLHIYRIQPSGRIYTYQNIRLLT